MAHVVHAHDLVSGQLVHEQADAHEIGVIVRQAGQALRDLLLRRRGCRIGPFEDVEALEIGESSKCPRDFHLHIATRIQSLPAYIEIFGKQLTTSRISWQ